jgi:hypothetical protein
MHLELVPKFLNTPPETVILIYSVQPMLNNTSNGCGSHPVENKFFFWLLLLDREIISLAT